MTSVIHTPSRRVAAATVVGLTGAVAVAVYGLAKGAASPIKTGAPAAYARLMTGPKLGEPLAQSVRVQAMARLARVDPTSLREVFAGQDSLGSLIAGLDASGKTCVAVASADAAGSFACSPFASSPIYLVTEAQGAQGTVAFVGFAGAADTVVQELDVRTADGSTRAVAMNAAGGFAYRTSAPAGFPVALMVRGTNGRQLLTVPFPETTPASSP